MSLRSAAAVVTLAVTLAGCAGTSMVARPADLTQLSVVEAAALIRERYGQQHGADAGLPRAGRGERGPERVHHARSGRRAGRRPAGRRRPRGGQEPGAAPRRAARGEGQHPRGRPAEHRRDSGAAGVRAQGARADRAAARRRGRRHPRQDEHARAGLRHLRLQRGLLHRPADRHAQPVRPIADRRGQLERHRRRRRRAAGARAGWAATPAAPCGSPPR